jgi:uncharacterized protein YdeI (YjbR/CyaY-like superfamily)
MSRKQLPRSGDCSPRFFASRADFRRWLVQHHDSARELSVGFYKKGSGRGGLDYKEAVDEALCFGWIDGLKKRIDAVSYMHRFSPRTPSSIWSAVNLKRMKELIAEGRVAKPGLAAYEQRDPKRSGLYSFENRPQVLDPPLERRFRANARAWTFFRAQPPGYQKVCVWFVMSAKKDETRLRRLETVIKVSSEEKRLKWM